MASSNAEPIGKQINAENRSNGSQFITDGQGDQNIISGNGVVYKDYRVIVNAPGIPSGWNLAETLNAVGSGPTRPMSSSISDWLKSHNECPPLDARRYHVEVKNQMANGTGSWILENDLFQLWQDPQSSMSMLAMQGIVGSGKTMLVSRIIDLISQTTKSKPGVACIYFYFESGSNVSPARIWLTLLCQLLQFECPAGVATDLMSSFESSFYGSASLHPAECFPMFVAQASMFSQVFLVLDGLDSWCTAHEQHKECLQNSLRKLPKTVKTLFTARADIIPQRLGSRYTIPVTPTASDVKTYIETRIEGHSRLNQILSNRVDRIHVTNKVADIVLQSGMFLLARLHLDKLSEQGLLADIQDALPSLSKDSCSAFDSCVAQIASRPKTFEYELARHVFTWVAHSRIGLTVDQIQDSFAMKRCRNGSYRNFRPNRNSLISACAGLVVVCSRDGLVSFVHESLRKHLYQHQLIAQNPDMEIAKTCLQCLSIDDVGNASRQSSLVSYAASYSFSHIGKLDVNRLDPECKRSMHDFLCNSAKLTKAFQSMTDIDNFEVRGMTGIHAAVYFDMKALAQNILSKRAVDINAKCIDGQTAVHWAVRMGRVQLLEYLVRKNADTNIQDKRNDTPLHKALMGSTTNNLEVVGILMNGGARIDIVGGKGLTPLSWAIRYGPTSVASSFIITQKDVNFEITKGWTTIRELLSHGDDIGQGLPPSQRSTAREAIKNHVQSLTDILLSQKLDLNCPTSDGWLPLTYTVKDGNASILKKLLTRNPDPADPNLRDSFEHQSPLRLAMTYKRTNLARILIDYGANVNEQDEDGWTPLHHAVLDKNESLVWLLLNRGAYPNALDKKNTPALVYAIQSQHLNIAWLLITHGADATQLNNRALELALEREDLTAAALLCQNRANPNFTDPHAATQLHKASRHGNAKTVEFLLNQGADVNCQDDTGSTSLHYAVLGGYARILTLLATRASSRGLELHDAHGNTPLILATLKQDKAIMRILLCNGASCDRPGSDGLTPLHHAVMAGFNDGLDLMIKWTENVDATDSHGCTALHHAAFNSSADCQTISLLVKGGANLDASEKNGFTPLMLATEAEKSEVVTAMVQLRADIHAHSKGWSALKLAHRLRNKEITRILEAAASEHGR